MRNDAWSLFTSWSPNVFVDSKVSGIRTLYFGNANGNGIVYHAFTGDDDVGANISAVIETREEDFGVPDRDKEFEYIEIQAVRLEGVDDVYAAAQDLLRAGGI